MPLKTKSAAISYSVNPCKNYVCISFFNLNKWIKLKKYYSLAYIIVGVFDRTNASQTFLKRPAEIDRTL